MRIQVNRELIKEAHEALQNAEIFVNTCSEEKRSRIRDIFHELGQILKNNPLPEKWVVVRIDDIVIKGSGTPQVSTEIVARFDSQKEAEEWLNQWNWWSEKGHNTFYVTRQIGKKRIRMHNLIMGTTELNTVDHIDLNGLNCQRNNLRRCTRSQNAKNRTPWGSSKYLGVSKT